MKKLMTGLLVLAAGAAWAAGGHEHHHEHAMEGGESEATTVLEGEVIDLACYMGHGAMGEKHQSCAKSCLVDKGIPAGLLTADGKLYLLLEDHSEKASKKAMSRVKHWAAEQVKVTGRLVEKGGLPALMVHAAEKE